MSGRWRRGWPRGRSPRGGSRVRAFSALVGLAVGAFGAGCSPGDPSREVPGSGPDETALRGAPEATIRGTPEAAIATWLRCEECVDGEREAILAVGEAAVPALRDALLSGPPERERLQWEAEMRRLHVRIETQADARGLTVADVDEFVERRVGNLVLRYRLRAADALGWIGGPQARDALEEAVRADSRGGRLLERIQAILDSM